MKGLHEDTNNYLSYFRAKQLGCVAIKGVKNI